MESEAYLPVVIYQNLKKFLAYRALILEHGALQSETYNEGQPRFLEDEKFIQEAQYYGFALIKAKDAPEKDRRFPYYVHPAARKRPVLTYIILLANDNTQHTDSTQNFEKLLRRVPDFSSQDYKDNMDIIIIAPDKLGSNLQKKIAVLTKHGDTEKGYLHIYPYEYSHFTTIIPENKSVPPHHVISRPKEQEVLRELFTEKSRLPRIRKFDPVNIWIGGEIGDIVEIDEFSEGTAIRRVYKVVVPSTVK